MTVDLSKEASGQPSDNASGDHEETTQENIDNDGEEQDEAKPPKRRTGSVSYESHQKLLREKKALQAKLAEIESEKKAKERQALEEQGEYKKIAELERERAAKLEQELTQYHEERTMARKLSAVLKGVGGKIHSKFYDLIPVDKVIVNPDTGEVDELSVSKVVEDLRKSYPEIISKGTPGMPQHAPQGGGGNTISYAEFRKLSSKEQSKWKDEQIIG